MPERLKDSQEYCEVRFYSGIIIHIDPESYPDDDRWVEILVQHDTAQRAYSTLGECSDVLIDAAVEGKLDVLGDPECLRMDKTEIENKTLLAVGVPVHVHEYKVQRFHRRRDGELDPYDSTQLVLCIAPNTTALTGEEIEQAKYARAERIIADAEMRYEEIKAKHNKELSTVTPVYSGQRFNLFDEVTALEVDDGSELLASKPKVLRIDEMWEPLIFAATLVDPSDDQSQYENGEGIKTTANGAVIGNALALQFNQLFDPESFQGCMVLKVRGKDTQGGTISYANQPLILESNGQHWYSQPDDWEFIQAAAVGPNSAEVVYDVFYPISADQAKRAIEDGVLIEIPDDRQGFRLHLPLDLERLAEIKAAFPKASQ